MRNQPMWKLLGHFSAFTRDQNPIDFVSDKQTIHNLLAIKQFEERTQKSVQFNIQGNEFGGTSQLTQNQYKLLRKFFLQSTFPF